MTKTLKTAALVFGAVLAWNGRAFAVCSGGMDGADSTFSGCSELGGLGNLVYERDAAGNVTRKRSEAEIKNYLVETIEKRGRETRNQNQSESGCFFRFQPERRQDLHLHRRFGRRRPVQ